MNAGRPLTPSEIMDQRVLETMQQIADAEELFHLPMDRIEFLVTIHGHLSTVIARAIADQQAKALAVTGYSRTPPHQNPPTKRK